MLIRSISLVFLILSLTNCSRLHETGSMAPPMQGGPQAQTTEPFTRVIVKGNIDVALYTGDTHPRVILHGDPRSMPDVQATVRNGLLYINVGKGSPHFGRVRAEIRTHYLTLFDYQGAGKVTADKLQSGMLDLSIDNSGETIINGKISLRKLLVAGSGYTQINGITGQTCQIKLSGKPHLRLSGIINLSSLNMSGDSAISLYWVKSNVLKIRAKDKAYIQMAGIVGTLDMELQGSARFNGRYLRGTDVFAKTYDHSVADICVTKTQHTLASNSSNIYFHNLPKMKADFMACNGSVLDMREWEVANMQEYTRYNR